MPMYRKAVLSLIFLAAFCLVIAFPVHHAASSGIVHVNVPAAATPADRGNNSSVNMTGIYGQIWNATWKPIAGIVSYFGNTTGILLNDSVIDFSIVIGGWSGSVAGTGIWSILTATVLLGIAFVGVWFILAIGDAVRDVTEVG